MADKTNETLDNLRELLVCEIEKIVKVGDLTEKHLEHIEKMVDAVKDIDEIKMKDEEMSSGYSQRRGYGRMFPDYNYEYGGGGYFENGNSYARTNNNNMYNGYNNNSNYSRKPMMEHYQDMLDAAQTENERNVIRQMMMRMN